MSELIAIRKIFQSLDKNDLGTPTARFKHDGHTYTITGLSEKGNIMYSGGNPDAQFADVLAVEWPIEEEKELMLCDKTLDECHTRGLFPDCFMNLGCRECPSWNEQLTSSVIKGLNDLEEKEPKLYAPAIIQLRIDQEWNRPEVSSRMYSSPEEAEKVLEYGDFKEDEDIVRVLHWPYGEPQELSAHKF